MPEVFVDDSNAADTSFSSTEAVDADASFEQLDTGPFLQLLSTILHGNTADLGWKTST